MAPWRRKKAKDQARGKISRGCRNGLRRSPGSDAAFEWEEKIMKVGFICLAIRGLSHGRIISSPVVTKSSSLFINARKMIANCAIGKVSAL
jgi:hypothetical protein